MGFLFRIGTLAITMAVASLFAGAGGKVSRFLLRRIFRR
jgi:hypothetical protein